MKNNIDIGKGSDLDANVMLGYKPIRSTTSTKLLIGNNAKIRSSSVIYLGTRIGNNLQTGHNVIIREENQIGDNLCIWSNSTIDYGCKIGDNVKIHNGVYVAQYSVLEDDVFLAPSVTLANDKYPGSKNSPLNLKGPTIKKGAQIGINSTILPGIIIGKNAIIGAGSVVTSDIPDESIAVGNPAKVVKLRKDIKSYS